MNIQELELILQAWRQPELDGIARESAQSAGSTYLRERLTVIAERCARDWEGDLVEVGCLNGSTTICLAKAAQLYNRRVIAIDPWEPNTQNISSDAREYDIFLETIKPYLSYIEVIKKDSRDPIIAEELRQRPLCFAFIDGLHEYRAVINDIKMCYHAKLLAIDDYTWSDEVKRGWYEATGNRLRIELPPLHEGYII